MRYLGILAAVGMVLAVTATAGATGLMWGSASPDWNSGNLGPVIFMFDSATGSVNQTFQFGSWNWIMAVADSGDYLYASHNTASDYGNMKIAKIDRTTGAILSDTAINGFLGTTYSQVNSLDYVGGTLYGVENCTWDTTYRGHAVGISLGAGGDPSGAVVGASIGAAPDGALDYHNGQWYASNWKSDSPASSWIKTTGDIMNTDFSNTVATSGIGFVSGWEFDVNGSLLGVTWNYNNFHVYSFDLGTGAATDLGYNMKSQLPSNITMMGGMSEVVPEPLTMAGLALGIGSLATYLRKRK